MPRPAPASLGPCPVTRLPEALDLLYQRHPEPLRGRTVAEVLRDHLAVGFSTYGEQYGGVHVNQTLTGIAFGCAPDR